LLTKRIVGTAAPLRHTSGMKLLGEIDEFVAAGRQVGEPASTGRARRCPCRCSRGSAGSGRAGRGAGSRPSARVRQTARWCVSGTAGARPSSDQYSFGLVRATNRTLTRNDATMLHRAMMT
jgi:hypothetical protein